MSIRTNNGLDIKGKRLPILFLANKSDLPNAHEPAEITDQLGLDRLSENPWTIIKCQALKGAGVQEGLSWLASVLKRNP